RSSAPAAKAIEVIGTRPCWSRQPSVLTVQPHSRPSPPARVRRAFSAKVVASRIIAFKGRSATDEENNSVFHIGSCHRVLIGWPAGTQRRQGRHGSRGSPGSRRRPGCTRATRGDRSPRPPGPTWKWLVHGSFGLVLPNGSWCDSCEQLD